ncbi:MAG: phosphotransferase, partial [Actinobacteria bacterium]|nr:phosphotransferase [Actinomycetota bacterium]
MRIGLDFDNTIANYDQAFPEVARILGYKTQTLNKRELKLELLKQPDGDVAWQKVQGLVYGKHIDLATLYPGVYEFVLRALSGNHQVFIVSHKTKLGHFDESRTPLRDAATNWLINQKLVGDSDSKIKLKNVFYAETRDEKIDKIIELQLDVFIDDLDEVLTDKSFPKKTKKILFGYATSTDQEISTMHSWREVGDELFGEINSSVILSGAKFVCPELNCTSAQRVEGRGNSKIFRVETSDGSIALKVYPDLAVDNRLRRKAEWQALKFLQQNKMRVPKPVQTDSELNWSLIEWIDGSPADPQNQAHLDQAANFIQKLHQASRAITSGDEF